jgi:ABC-type multidrug transport system fused ATPase/permease subunit
MQLNNDAEFRLIDVPKALWYFIAEDRKKFVAFSVILLVSLTYDLLPPYIIGKILDFIKEFKTGESIRPLIYLVSFLAFSSATAAIIRLGSKRGIIKIGINSRYRAKVWGFNRLLGFSLQWHQQENTGNKAQRIISGSDAIREWSNEIINNIFPTIVSFVGVTAVCLMMTPYFAFFFVLYFGILILFELRFDKKISKVSDKINKSMENASGSFIEQTSNILSVKALGAGSSMSQTIADREQISQLLLHQRASIHNSKRICFMVHNSIAWGFFIFCVGYSVIKGHITIGLMLTYTSYFDTLRLNATELVNHVQQMIERKSNLARMMPFFWGDHTLHKGNKTFPQKWTAISISDATFRYKDTPATDGINLEVQRGQKIGIAGHSGSGKSTLIKLMLGLYHVESGSIKIGDTSIPEIQHDELTSNISVVLQETELFNMSLKENISMMKGIDADIFRRICGLACLDDVISRLPNGADTLIGERGYFLSGGERQRVGIARALCKNASIMLLDEATSALDTVTENLVMNALLKEYDGDSTMLIVAHRFSTLRNTDRIIVFENGKIVEEGTFDGLLSVRTSRFGTMYYSQEKEIER